jgi:hypothetical protein
VSDPEATPHNPLWELRRELLTNPPADAGSLVASGTSVWGVLMETGYEEGPVTLLVIGDGTTSLYFPAGGGIIGAGQHAAVAAASTALLITADAMKVAFAPVRDIDFPSQGRVRILILTTSGVLSAEEDEEALGHGTGPLSAVFHAGHAVISQVRIASEQHGSR